MRRCLGIADDAMAVRTWFGKSPADRPGRPAGARGRRRSNPQPFSPDSRHEPRPHALRIIVIALSLPIIPASLPQQHLRAAPLQTCGTIIPPHRTRTQSPRCRRSHVLPRLLRAGRHSPIRAARAGFRFPRTHACWRSMRLPGRRSCAANPDTADRTAAAVWKMRPKSLTMRFQGTPSHTI